MKNKSSATVPESVPLSPTTHRPSGRADASHSVREPATGPDHAAVRVSWAGLGWGLLGVLAFSLTLPLTRLSVTDGGLSPLFVAAGRATLAAVFAAVALAVTRQRRPRGVQWLRLAVVAGGVVLGFPLLTSLALTSAPAGNGAVVVALLPAGTAVLAVLRGRERPGPLFWATACAGATAAVCFALLGSGGELRLTGGDLLLLGAVLAAAAGYAEGGLLARELGAWQTISWALVLSAPLTGVLTVLSLPSAPGGTPPHAWAAFGYLAAVSMFLGFFAWYRGLAIGPITQVSQVQLVQPVLTLGWAALLLHETPTPVTVVGGAAVVAAAATTVRARNPRNPRTPSAR